jgi:uncharacterized protein YajQ (UPF0234 family)
MATFSFDIVSEYDKAEMNNIFAGTEREIGNRYDFKGTPAAIEWLNGDKTGIKIIGANQWQCDAILDVIRKKLASREQSTKVLDVTKTPQESNLKTTWEIPFKHGLSQEDAKKITKQLREEAPKAKAQIQGDAVRVTSASKDELQKVITLLKAGDYDFPLEFINYR